MDNSHSIRQALVKIKRQDISGLAVLVQQYQLRAIRTADLITRDSAIAQDVVQMAFIKCYERIQQYDMKRPFEAWLMQIVVNDALKAVSRHKGISLEETTEAGYALEDVLPTADPDPLEQVIHAEFKQAVWQALGQLTVEQRAVIVMKYYLNYSENDISEAINSPISTVKGRLYTARQRLHPLLETLVREESEA